MAYFKQSGIKTRIIDPDGGHREAIESGSETGGSGRRRAGKTGESANIDADMDDEESEEDEDFVDDGSNGSGDDEDGEEEGEDDDMVDVSVDKDELKALKKNE